MRQIFADLGCGRQEAHESEIASLTIEVLAFTSPQWARASIMVPQSQFAALHITVATMKEKIEKTRNQN